MIPVGDDSINVVPGVGSLWAINNGDGDIQRDGRRPRWIALAHRPDKQPCGSNSSSPWWSAWHRVRVRLGLVWATNGGPDGAVFRINPSTNAITRRIDVSGGSPSQLLATHKRIWATDRRAQALLEIDPAENRVIGRIPLDGDTINLALGEDGAIWVAGGGGNDRLYRIDPTRLAITATLEPGFALFAVAASADTVWATSPDVGELIRVDPPTGAVVARYRTGPRTSGLALDGTHAWVTLALEGVVQRIDLKS